MSIVKLNFFRQIILYEFSFYVYVEQGVKYEVCTKITKNYLRIRFWSNLVDKQYYEGV